MKEYKQLLENFSLSSLFSSPAFAQAQGAKGGFDIMSMIPLALFFVVIYFLLIRPQQKKAKQQREMLQALRRGDRVLTAGGIIGTITKIEGDEEVQVEISEGVRVRMARATIGQVLAKTEPVKVKAEESESEEEASAPSEKPAPKKFAPKKAPVPKKREKTVSR